MGRRRGGRGGVINVGDFPRVAPAVQEYARFFVGPESIKSASSQLFFLSWSVHSPLVVSFVFPCKFSKRGGGGVAEQRERTGDMYQM